MKTISASGKSFIKKFEGCRLTAYKPVQAEKYYTIGWGHYGADVKKGQKITQAEADKMFDKDILQYAAYVNNLKFCPQRDSLNQSQFDALVSICYNCGCGNLQKLCVGRSLCEVCQKIETYCIKGADGKVLEGLKRRRKEEAEMFRTGSHVDENVSSSNKLNVSTLKKGSRGNDVLALQKALCKLMNKSISLDGVFGDKTLDLVKAFQKANGLVADGIVGEKTLVKINSKL